MTNEELVRLIKGGNTDLIKDLWLNVEKFINMQAGKRLRRTLTDMDFKKDLYQSGYFALLSAIETYNFESKFTTYLNYFLLREFNNELNLITAKQRNEPLNNAISLNATINDDEDITLMDTLIDPAAEEEFNKVISVDTCTYLTQVINSLPSKYQTYLNILLKHNLDKIKASKELGMTYGEAYCVWQYQNATFGNQKCNYQYQPGLPH